MGPLAVILNSVSGSVADKLSERYHLTVVGATSGDVWSCKFIVENAKVLCRLDRRLSLVSEVKRMCQYSFCIQRGVLARFNELKWSRFRIRTYTI